MKSLKIYFALVGAILLILSVASCSKRDDWHNHLTDPGLGGVAPKVDPWVGKWYLIKWWATDETGAVVEGPDEWEPSDDVGSLTLNDDGTYVMDIPEFDDLYFEGSYTVVNNVLTMECDDDWWGQPWNLSFSDEGNLRIGVGDWPTGEGEGYEFQKE